MNIFKLYKNRTFIPVIAILVCMGSIAISFMGIGSFIIMINTHQGIELIDNQRYDEAIETLNKVIDKDPNMYIAYRERALAYYNIGLYNMALADCNKTLELYPKDYNAYATRATIYYEMEELEKAFDDCNTMIAIYPNFATAYTIRAMIHYDRADYYLVIQDCNRAISLYKDFALPYYIRGLVSYKAGLRDASILEEAIVDFSKAIELEPNGFEFYYQRGLAYKNLGDKEKANLDFYRVMNFSNDVDLVLLAEQQVED